MATSEGSLEAPTRHPLDWQNPDFYDPAKVAREEGFPEIADWFETLAKAEKSHAGRFQQLLDNNF